MGSFLFILIFSLLEFVFCYDFPELNYTVVNSFPHDSKVVTQGLYYDQNLTLLYEGSGDFLTCKIKIMKSNKVILSTDYCNNKNNGVEYWGYGFTVLDHKIYQLIRATKILVYHTNLTFIEEIPLPIEAFGITYDQDENLFVLSSGDHTLRYFNHSFLEVNSIPITQTFENLQLNKIAWIHGEIWATLVNSFSVIRVSKTIGILGYLNFTGLNQETLPRDSVAALASFGDDFLVVGRKWKKMYQVSIPHSPQTATSVPTSEPTSAPSSAPSSVSSSATVTAQMNGTESATKSTNETLSMPSTIDQSTTSTGEPPDTKDSTVVPQAVVFSLVIVSKILAVAYYHFRHPQM